MAERFGQRPSRLLNLPPDDDWLCYCVDEALHVLLSGHELRERTWQERWRKATGKGDAGDPGDDDLYRRHRASGRLGKPPDERAMAALRQAAEYSGREVPA